VAALAEIGIDAADYIPRRLDDKALEWADVAVSVCRDEVCPVTPGVRTMRWEIRDPVALPLDEVRAIRNEIDGRVERLLAELDG
jgi:protein-tyrosine-phosphatase